MNVSFLDGLALVALLFVARKSYQNLDPTFFIIHLQRHYCQPFLRGFPDELSDLFFVQKEPAGAHGVVVFWCVFGLVGGDIGIEKNRLFVADDHKRAGQVDVPAFDGFYLESEQLNACLVSVEDLVIKARGSIDSYVFHGILMLPYGNVGA